MNDLSILDEEEITQLVGAGFSLCFTCSYIISLFKVYKQRFAYEEYPIISLFFCYFNNLMWTKYSDLIYHESMKSLFQYSNIISIVIISLYSLYEIRKDIIDMVLNILILITSTFAIRKLLMDILIEEEKVKMASGYSMIILYLSCLEWIYRAKSAKNTNILNTTSCLFLVGNAVCLTYYGIKYDDKFYIYSNAVGIIVGIIYIITWYYMKKKYGYEVPVKKEEDKDKKDSKENDQDNKEIKDSEKKEVNVKLDDNNNNNNDDENQKLKQI